MKTFKEMDKLILKSIAAVFYVGGVCEEYHKNSQS